MGRNERRKIRLHHLLPAKTHLPPSSSIKASPKLHFSLNYTIKPHNLFIKNWSYTLDKLEAAIWRGKSEGKIEVSQGKMLLTRLVPYLFLFSLKLMLGVWNELKKKNLKKYVEELKALNFGSHEEPWGNYDFDGIKFD